MHLNSTRHSSKYNFSTTRYPQSPSASLENTVSKHDSIHNLLSVSNISVDLNIEKRDNKNHDKKINIIELPTEILNKIFSYTGGSKTNVRLTCHRFNDCVKLNKEELFKITNSEFLSKNGFNPYSINHLAKQKKEIQSFILRNCTLLHELGFSTGMLFYISEKSTKEQVDLLKTCEIMKDSGFSSQEIYHISSMPIRSQEFILELCNTQHGRRLNHWNIISLAIMHDCLIKKAIIT